MNLKQPSSAVPFQPNALNALATQLNIWRSKRTNRRVPIPESLRQKAVELLAHYPRTQIITTLGISSGMLKTWESTAFAAQPQFVAMSLEHPSTNSDQPPLEIVLANNRGQRITLQGEFSQPQLTLLVRALHGFTEEVCL